MRILIFSVLSLLLSISCVHNNGKNKKLLLSVNNDLYNFKLFSVDNKYNDGSVQCDKYEVLNVRDGKVDYYGTNLAGLLAFLHGTKKVNIEIDKDINNSYLHFKYSDVKLNTYDSVITDILKFYNITETKYTKKTKVYNLVITDSVKLNKYIVNNNDSLVAALNIEGNSLSLSNYTLKQLITEYNNIYKSEIFVTNIGLTKRFSFEVKNINDFRKSNNFIKDNVGVEFISTEKEIVYYKYKKNEIKTKARVASTKQT